MNIKEQLQMQKLYATGAFKAAPAADVPTRESIATLEKADVLEWLEAHGDEPDGRWGVERLRDRLVSIMFADL